MQKFKQDGWLSCFRLHGAALLDRIAPKGRDEKTCSTESALRCCVQLVPSFQMLVMDISNALAVINNYRTPAGWQHLQPCTIDFSKASSTERVLLHQIPPHLESAQESSHPETPDTVIVIKMS